MKNMMRLLPILLILLSFQGFHTSNTFFELLHVNYPFDLQVGANMVAAASEENAVSVESAKILSDNEARITVIIISGVVLFLLSMYFVRRKIKKAIKQKAEL
jgi:hypothetical protein